MSLIESKNIVGIGEIADRYKVTKQAVCNWRERNSDFPKPLTILKGGPLWDKKTIFAWAKQNGKT